MRWGDIVSLISTVRTQNSLGDTTETKSYKQKFANKKSVKRVEFYQALATGLKPEVIFEVKAIDYNDETKLLHESKEYNIIRTYSVNGEDIELVCNRMVGG